jgi:hypothetical protein
VRDYLILFCTLGKEIIVLLLKICLGCIDLGGLLRIAIQIVQVLTCIGISWDKMIYLISSSKFRRVKQILKIALIMFKILRKSQKNLKLRSRLVRVVLKNHSWEVIVLPKNRLNLPLEWVLLKEVHLRLKDQVSRR